jgi:hypothetical protein
MNAQAGYVVVDAGSIVGRPPEMPWEVSVQLDRGLGARVVGTASAPTSTTWRLGLRTVHAQRSRANLQSLVSAHQAARCGWWSAPAIR